MFIQNKPVQKHHRMPLFYFTVSTVYANIPIPNPAFAMLNFETISNIQTQYATTDICLSSPQGASKLIKKPDLKRLDTFSTFLYLC